MSSQVKMGRDLDALNIKLDAIMAHFGISVPEERSDRLAAEERAIAYYAPGGDGWKEANGIKTSAQEAEERALFDMSDMEDEEDEDVENLDNTPNTPVNPNANVQNTSTNTNTNTPNPPAGNEATDPALPGEALQGMTDPSLIDEGDEGDEGDEDDSTEEGSEGGDEEDDESEDGDETEGSQQVAKPKTRRNRAKS